MVEPYSWQPGSVWRYGQSGKCDCYWVGGRPKPSWLFLVSFWENKNPALPYGYRCIPGWIPQNRPGVDGGGGTGRFQGWEKQRSDDHYCNDCSETWHWKIFEALALWGTNLVQVEYHHQSPVIFCNVFFCKLWFSHLAYVGQRVVQLVKISVKKMSAAMMWLCDSWTSVTRGPVHIKNQGVVSSFASSHFSSSSAGVINGSVLTRSPRARTHTLGRHIWGTRTHGHPPHFRSVETTRFGIWNPMGIFFTANFVVSSKDAPKLHHSGHNWHNARMCRDRRDRRDGCGTGSRSCYGATEPAPTAHAVARHRMPSGNGGPRVPWRQQGALRSVRFGVEKSGICRSAEVLVTRRILEGSCGQEHVDSWKVVVFDVRLALLGFSFWDIYFLILIV